MALRKPSQKREKTKYTVSSVTNMISILEFISESDHEVSIQEISSHLSLTKSITVKLLATLELFSYIEYNKESNTFSLGIKIFQISQAYIKKLNIVEIASQSLKHISQQLNETSYVGIIDNGTVVYLNMEDTTEPIKVKPRVGHVGYAYATAIGKALLSTYTDQEIEILYSNGFSHLTEHTIKTIPELLTELDKVRASGYAIDYEEFESDIICVAVPIMDFMGKAVAGISVTVPKIRMSDERIANTIVPLLLEVSKSLSLKFGYNS